MRKRLFFCIGLVCFAQLSWGEITGEIELLKALADQHEANGEKLHTWRGTARVTYSVSEGLGEEAVDRQGIYQADFLVGRSAKANRWKTTPLEYIFGEEGATEADMPPQIMKGILGKSLPDFDGIQIDYTAAQAQERRVLMCFVDIGQRPSRHCLKELAQRSQQFREGDVELLVVQDSLISKQELTNWLKTNAIDLCAGMITGQQKKLHYTWGIHSLPWLILTDKTHIVTHEGITLNALDTALLTIEDTEGVPQNLK
jgi:hypothetical protein